MTGIKGLLQKIENTNRRYGLFKKNDILVAGVSGGADSMALLWLLETLRAKYAFRVHVAHLNHGLLKPESKSYLDLVEKSAKALKFPFYSKAIDLKKIAKKNKRSIEEMGRIARYSFFEAIALKTRANKIVTAHTLDDQAETVLLRLLRGTGLKGLIGIPFKRPQGATEVIRPLLAVEKAELLSFLKVNKLPFIQDKTNRDTTYTRNRIRHRLIPLLARSYNPQIKSSLSNLQTICGQIQDYLDKISSRSFTSCWVRPVSRNEVRLRLSTLKKLHPAIRQEVLLRALSDLKGDVKKISYEHIASILDILQTVESGLECHLPDSVLARTDGHYLRLLIERR